MIWLPNEEKNFIYQAVAEAIDAKELKKLITKYSNPDRYLLCDSKGLGTHCEKLSIVVDEFWMQGFSFSYYSAFK